MFKNNSGSLVPGDNMSTNLQTAQPALTLFLSVYHCYAELTAEIQKPCLGTWDGNSRLR